jgi:hypothetical protein
LSQSLFDSHLMVSRSLGSVDIVNSGASAASAATTTAAAATGASAAKEKQQHLYKVLVIGDYAVG